MIRSLALLIMMLGVFSSLHAQVDSPQLVIRHPLNVYECSFSPDGKLLLTVCQDGNIRLWDAVTGELEETLGAEVFLRMYYAAFSPDGNFVVGIGPQKTIRVWNVADPGEPWSFESAWNEGMPFSMANFTHDSRKLVLAASADFSVRVIDIATSYETRFTASQRQLTCAMPSPTSNTLVTMSEDSTLRIWTLDGEIIHQYPLYTISNFAVYSPSGQKMIIDQYGAPGGDPAVIDSNGTMFPRLTGHTTLIGSAGFSGDGRYAVTADYRGAVRVFRTPLYHPVRTIKYPIRVGVDDAALNRDGSRVAICPGDSTVSIYSVQPADVRIETGRVVELAVRTVPNPVDDQLRLELMVEEAGSVRIQLYDALGRVQQTVVDTHLGAGLFSTEIDTRALTPGAYTITVRSSAGQAAHRIVVAR